MISYRLAVLRYRTSIVLDYLAIAVGVEIRMGAQQNCTFCEERLDVYCVVFYCTALHLHYIAFYRILFNTAVVPFEVKDVVPSSYD